jgi:hypothetical protein
MFLKALVKSMHPYLNDGWACEVCVVGKSPVMEIRGCSGFALTLRDAEGNEIGATSFRVSDGFHDALVERSWYLITGAVAQERDGVPMWLLIGHSATAVPIPMPIDASREERLNIVRRGGGVIGGGGSNGDSTALAAIITAGTYKVVVDIRVIKVVARESCGTMEGAKQCCEPLMYIGPAFECAIHGQGAPSITVAAPRETCDVMVGAKKCREHPVYFGPYYECGTHGQGVPVSRRYKLWAEIKDATRSFNVLMYNDHVRMPPAYQAAATSLARPSHARTLPAGGNGVGHSRGRVPHPQRGGGEAVPRARGLKDAATHASLHLHAGQRRRLYLHAGQRRLCGGGWGPGVPRRGDNHGGVIGVGGVQSWWWKGEALQKKQIKRSHCHRYDCRRVCTCRVGEQDFYLSTSRWAARVFLLKNARVCPARSALLYV